MTRLVVFDLDGTLVDSSEDLQTAMNATLAEIAPGAAPLSLPAIRTFIGEGAQALVARSLEASHVSRPVDEVLPLYIAHYRECLLCSTKLYPGVEEVLERLSDRILAVLTNKPGDLSREILEGLGVATRFAWIHGGGDVPKKPDPAGLMKIMKDAWIPPAEAVMVGDSPIDVRTGRSAGVRTIGAAYGLDPEGLRSEPPDVLLHDIRELPLAL